MPTKEWIEKHKDYLKEYKNKWYLENRERLLKKKSKYYEEYRKECIEYSIKWNKEHPDKRAVNSKIWKINHLSEYIEYNKKWVRDNPEKIQAKSQRSHYRRKTLEKNYINTLTSKEWLDILEVYNYRCAYCDVEFDCENLPTRDHIIPLTKGGNNVKENIIPACRSCNSKKNNKLYSKEVIL